MENPGRQFPPHSFDRRYFRAFYSLLPIFFSSTPRPIVVRWQSHDNQCRVVIGNPISLPNCAPNRFARHPLGIFFTYRRGSRGHTHAPSAPLRSYSSVYERTSSLRTPNVSCPARSPHERKNPRRQNAEQTTEVSEMSTIAACRERRSLVCHAQCRVSLVYRLCCDSAR